MEENVGSRRRHTARIRQKFLTRPLERRRRGLIGAGEKVPSLAFLWVNGDDGLGR